MLLAISPLAQAQQIVPPDFFARIPTSSGGQMAVSADTMVFNQNASTVTAQGNVGISFDGYRATADRAVYYQSSGRVELVGNVAFVDPEGVEYVADRVDLEDGFREGFLNALTVAFPDGTYFTAAETSFDQGVERVYVDGIYAPCGTCIDANGNTIGWTVKAARIITDETEQVIYFEQPSLQLLGFSVLWLPSLSLPSDADIELPVLSYDEDYGVGISLPFFNYPIAGGNLAVTPAVYTSQGPGLTLDWTQRIGALRYNVTGSGVYQFNPGAYTGLANRNVRGAVQTSGTFTPTDEWTLGWSATAFTDPGYLPDYRVASGTARNQLYAQYLTSSTFADVRTQQFVPLGNQPSQLAFDTVQNRQAATLPNARAEHIVDLEENGRVTLEGKLLGLRRAADDQSGLFSGQRYTHGYQGQSVHAMMQASWTNQYIAPGGIAISPYVGARGDLAHYDGASALRPTEQTLFSITPIAALDVRYPLLARTGGASHVIEPIVQLVYRDGPTAPGIINNDSQGFVFTDSNLFSFNRFSGTDRQETGLRANVGGALQTNFDNGAWLGGVFGQSFHLAGTNSFATTDGSTAGIGSGLATDNSYIVAGLQGGWGTALSGGAKIQIDPATGDVPRLQMAARTTLEQGYAFNADYAYIAANADLGTVADRHEIAVGTSIPLMDYWTAKGSVAWDLASNQWLETQGGLEYNDKFLAFGIGTRFTGPTHRTPNDIRVGLNFRLSAAGNQEIVGLDYSFEEF